MTADPHPALRATADVLYLVGEGVAAVLIGTASAVNRTLAAAEPPARSAGTTVTARMLLVDQREVTFLGASAITALLVGAARTPSATSQLRLVVGGPRRR